MVAFFKLCPAEALRCGRCPCVTLQSLSPLVTPPPAAVNLAQHRLCPPKPTPTASSTAQSSLSVLCSRCTGTGPRPTLLCRPQPDINTHHTAIRQQASVATALPPTVLIIPLSVLANRPPPDRPCLPTPGRTLYGPGGTRRRRRNARAGCTTASVGFLHHGPSAASPHESNQ